MPDTGGAASLQALPFTALNSGSGLPSDAVMVSLQDHRGFVWLGTTSGLARYDGRHVQTFPARPEQPGTLSHPFIHALLDDGQGTLWVGTNDGVDRLALATEQVRRVALPPGLALQQRRALGLAPRTASQLWVGLAAGLHLLDRQSEQFTRWEPPAELALADERLRAFTADGQGGVWFAQGDWILHVDARGQLRQRLRVSAHPSAADRAPAQLLVRSLLVDPGGRLWVGMSGGLQVWTLDPDGLGVRPDAALSALPVPRTTVFALVQDREGGVWIGLGDHQGLLQWRDDGQGLRRYQHQPAVPDSLASDSVASLMIDRDGVLWVGSWGKGLSLADLRSGGFLRYHHVPGDERSLSGDSPMAFAPDDAEHVWVGIYGGGLNRLHLASGDTERIPASQLPLRNLKTLLRDRDGQLWAGGDGGLMRFDPRQRRSQVVPLQAATPSAASISALVQDRQGRVWGSSASGLYRIEGGGQRVQRYSARPGVDHALQHDTIDCLLEDRDGRLWVGTKGGLYLYRPDTDDFDFVLSPDRVLTQPQKLAVHALRQDVRGRLWLAGNQGVFELRQDADGWHLRDWSGTPGLGPGSYDALQDTLDGEIWLGAEDGLVQLVPDQQRARRYPGRSRFGGGVNFGAAARGPDGSLFFGSTGIIRFHPSQLRDNPQAPGVVLSDLRLHNQSLLPDAAAASSAQRVGSSASVSLRDVGITGPLHAARHMQLGHEEAMVSFELSALHFADPRRNRYAWLLEGFDRDWIQGRGEQAMATYTNLDPGHYRLLGRAANPDGVWSEQQTLIEIEVLPPFWRTWWWRSGVLLAVLAMMAWAYRWRTAALHAARLTLEAKVAERTAEVVEQGQQLQVEKHQAEAQREAAEKARRSITLLSEIGRDITATRDLPTIQQTLYAHVSELMNASVFGVGRVNWEAGVIDFEFVMQDGQPFMPYQRSLSALEQPSVQCVLESRELMIDEFAQDIRRLDQHVRQRSGQDEARLADGRPVNEAHSGIYVPMQLKGRVMGVIAVLSGVPKAFGVADLDILRTLGAYAAVAYDNAEAYRRLQLAQDRLVEQEKLAALGALVAGVAHELNTPIGNSLLMASTLRDASRDFLQRAQGGGLRRSELQSFCEGSEASTTLLLRSLEQAANLIASFKQLAVDQTSDQRRRFDLAQTAEEVVMTLSSRIRREEHEMSLELQPGLELDSFPGPLGQVISNLVLNAMLHGFEGRKGGRMRLTAQAQGADHVLVEFTDNGGGIPPEHLRRIFEPFFTTRLGQGGSGLGLHICYNIVHTLLGGSIRVQSVMGEGTRFVIELPRVAPAEGAEAQLRPPAPPEDGWEQGGGV